MFDIFHRWFPDHCSVLSGVGQCERERERERERDKNLRFLGMLYPDKGLLCLTD